MSEPQPFVPSGRSHCHLCGKKLPLLRKIFGSGFCGDSHRSAYAVQQNEMALARLQGAALEAPAMCLLRADNAPQTRVDEMTEAHQILDFACFIKC